MEKYIQKLLKALRIEVVAVWVITVLAVCLGELNVIPNGWVEPHSQHEFVLNMAVVMLSIICIPVAIRLFTLNTTKGLRRMNNDEALTAYHVWSVVRMGILCITAVFGIVVYYIATSTSAALCALIALCVTIYCWPSKEKIETYLTTHDND